MALPSCRGLALVLLHLIACVSFASRTRSYNGGPRITDVRLPTKQGRIRGIVQHYGGDITYSKFLGIPYAQPPIGERRFKDPHKHTGWALSNELNATYYRPFCISNRRSRGSQPRHRHYTESEDCLFLNLYIPRNLSYERHVNTLGLPVVVYLHGWTKDDGIDRVDNTWSMAAAGDLIVAQVNYRIGALGFMSLDDRLTSGNFGLHDQRMAMHWIWDNIREFGGSPERITLLGASSGAMAVGLHMISPLSRGIFHRAIGQSGTALNPGIFQTDAVQNALDLAASLHCPTDNLQATMDCLRITSVHDLVFAASDAKLLNAWLPVIDNNFVPDDPVSLLDQGSFNPVDYLTGVNSQEGYSLLSTFGVNLYDISQDQLEDLIAYCVGRFYTQNVDIIRRTVIAEYTSCQQEKTQRQRTLVEFLTDFNYIMPMDLAARLMTKRGERKVFLYNFSHRPSLSNLPRELDYIYAKQGDEFDFVMGQLPPSATTSEQKLSQTLQDAWINFAKFGDPNPVVPGLLWKQYVASNGDYVKLDTSLSGSSARNGLRSRQMALMNSYVHELSKSPTCDRSTDQCERFSRPLRQGKEQASVAVAILAAACVLLMLTVVFLLCKVRLAPEKWKKFCSCFDNKPKKKQQAVREHERKKLHPLPYYDEPT